MGDFFLLQMDDSFTEGLCFDYHKVGKGDQHFRRPPFSAKVSVGYPRNGGKARARTRRPRHQGRARTRQRGQGTPSRPCRRGGARGRRSAPLRCRRDPQWVGARGVR